MVGHLATGGETPVVVWHGEVLRNPTPDELAHAIGLPDIPGAVEVCELADRATVQARKFGARLAVPATAVALDRSDGHYVIRLASGQALETRSVVIATGARYTSSRCRAWRRSSPTACTTRRR